MIIPRLLSRTIEKSKKSLLLLGPRQTGKSTLIKALQPDLTINLAHEPTFLDYVSDPRTLEAQIALKKPRTILVDEVQRLPSLLNTIQVLLDEKPNTRRFFLTGSSARKLRRGKANLLPGRILSAELGPLVSLELGDHFLLSKALSVGTLPGIYLEDSLSEQQNTLLSYAAVYLKEEIQAEALTKDLEGFARFLRHCSARAGNYLDLSKLASEAQVKRASAIRFFEILEDTLIVRRCDAFSKSETRRLVQHPRYFFFDNGVLNGILGNFHLSIDRQGQLFEHFVMTQIYHTAAALGKPLRISNYRTEHGAEVDLILEFSDGSTWAIECKAGVNAGKNDLTGFKSFQSYFGKRHGKMIIYGGTIAKEIEGIKVLPFALAMETLFAQKF